LRKKLNLEYISALIIGFILMHLVPFIGKIVWPYIEDCLIEDLPEG
jgi:hypothetical protein